MNNTKLYVALGVVVVAAVVGVIFLQSQDKQKVEVSLSNSSASKGTYDYNNDGQGYGLTLNEAWDGYKVFEVGADASVKNKFCVQTSDMSFVENNVDAGYACPFSVFGISDTSWNAMEPLEHASFGEPTATKNGTRFFVEPALTLPSDLASVNFDLPAIKASFR